MNYDSWKTIKNAEDLVMKILEKNVKAREDDVELVFATWEEQGLHLTSGQRNYIHRCYSSETITRARRTIQHERGLFKSSPIVQQQRTLLEEDRREHYRGKK